MSDREPEDPPSRFSLNGARSNGRFLRATPGIMRLTAAAAWRTTAWTVTTTSRVYGRLARAAVSGESATELFQATEAYAREYGRRLLGIIEGEGMVRAPGAGEDKPDGNGGWPLRERGAELLRKSADVRFEEDSHPAYERMLEEIAPDEGRILRMLALKGPQPSVDVRKGGILGIASQLVEPGLSMIGAEAGCRYSDRVHSYLNNLFRLGLIWFSREAVEDPLRYQVLEAQPEVVEALQSAGRTSTVRRSIYLTPFGHDFCVQCLPLAEDESTEIDSGQSPT